MNQFFPTPSFWEKRAVYRVHSYPIARKITQSKSFISWDNSRKTLTINCLEKDASTECADLIAQCPTDKSKVLILIIQSLYLENLEKEDSSLLEGFSFLKELDLRGNTCLKSTRGIASVSDTLEKIHLQYTAVTNLSQMDMCHKLKGFYASRSSLQDKVKFFL